MSTNPSKGGQNAVAGLFSAGVAALGVALAWGFVVDDAWITARVAWRLANGFGYRFNALGPRVDAVTPLGWVFVLVPFAKQSLSDALLAARIIGATAWIAAAGWLGYRIRASGKKPYLVVPLLAAAPLSAWSSSGMETGLVLALATMALGESLGAAFAGGIIAAWRPELIPYCVVLSLRALWSKRGIARFFPLTLSLGSAIGVAIVRQLMFGRPMPLAVLAKPSDLQHGFQYVLGVLLFTGPTWLWFGGGWKGLTRNERLVAVSVVAHFTALIAAGGDWMPLWRLAVPAMPAALWVAVCLQVKQRRHFFALRFAVATVVSIVVWVEIGIPGRHVMQARASLIEAARPALSNAARVATLDVGWAGAAFSGEILDLAGVTDPRVALLSGGHTSKNIQNSWFDWMQPDALVLLSAPGESIRDPWTGTLFARVIENRMGSMAYWQECRFTRSLELRHTQQMYAIVSCPLKP